MKKYEAKWQTIFNQYLKESKMLGYFELKRTENDYLPFNKIEDHQIDGLLACRNNGFVWKLSDEDSRQKPFDCFSTPPLPAYLVIKFPNGFYCIEIEKIIKMKKDGMVRITQDEAEKKASKIIRL